MTLYTSTTPVTPVPVTWTDTPLNMYRVKDVHTEELRSALEALSNHTHTVPGGTMRPARSFVGWTDDPVGTTVEIKKDHINQLIISLRQQDNHTHPIVPQAYWTWGTPTYYDPALTFTKYPLTTTDKPLASSYEELRTYLEGFATHTHSVCCECECTCTCTCTCTCQCTGDGGGKGT